MTEVEFHTGIDDPVAFACRLLGKAYRSGARVLVTAPAARLDALDKALWLHDDREFLPHVKLPAASAVLARTPLWLSQDATQARAAALSAAVSLPPVLLNLGGDASASASASASHEGFTRLIEVVGAEADEVNAGRQRWRDYLALGLAPQLRTKSG